MDFAIACNNYGSLLFDKGYFSEATRMFQTAVSVVSEILQGGGHNCSQDKQWALQVLATKSNPFSVKSVHNPLSYEKHVCIIYDKPLQINPENLDQNLLTIHSSAILFNLGLTYHARRTNSSLKRAMSFYQIAYSLLVDIDEAHTEQFHRLAIATLNNMAQVHEELGCFSQMLDTLEILSQYILSENSPTSEGVLEEMNDLITGALLFTDIKEVSAAPAA